MNVVIVDDEPLAREGLRLLLAAHADVAVVGEAGNGRDGATLIAARRPDVALVDIQMPEMGGLEMAVALADRVPPAIIFVTAHDEFALRAFDAHALDYVLKPVAEQRLAAALERARLRCRQVAAEAIVHQLRAALDNVQTAARPSARPTEPERICVRVGERRLLLAWGDVDWIEAADYYVDLHVGAASYLHREPLAQLEQRLEAAGFVRIHRSRLVNRARVRELRWDGRKLVVVLATGGELEVARRCHARLRAAFGG